jgi:hypothetical protein
MTRRIAVEIGNATVDQATHLLRCRHQIGRNGFDYTMPCIILGKTKIGKTKVLVFGERYWKYKEHIKSIRYVWSYRLIKRKAEIREEVKP